MWLENLGSKINELSYDGIHPHGQLSNLFKGAKGKEFSPPVGYKGALPTDEDPWEVVDNFHPVNAELIGVDGSHIYPDAAEPLPWAYAHAMATTSPVRHVSRFISPGELLRAKAASGQKLINTIRFSSELELAASCAQEFGNKPVVLLDGPILPPGRTSYEREGLGEELLDRALSELDDSVGQGGMIAGFTPNGHARYVSNLLLPMINRKVVKSLITKGQRTALYKRMALDEREVYFFYTTQGRVEFPFKPSLDVINSVWGCVKEGYPSELAAAHHLAVIPRGTATHLKAIVRSNLKEEITGKQIAKLHKKEYCY